jgi:hypothetical protein
MGKIDLNEWPLSGPCFVTLNVRLWAFLPEPTFSRGIHF